MLAQWSSWGAVPDAFDESKANWARERAELKSLLSEDAYKEARRTTINAHYTDPAYVRETWRALEQLGFSGGRVLEPGVGAGTFVGMAPAGAEMVGVELDSTTAAITRGLYPHAEIRTESFAETRYPAGYFDAAIGNVPFGEVKLHDPLHNAGQHSLHNHFILKSLALTRPGGVVAVLTSHFTMDGQNPAARREMNGMADLVGAVRLPSGAHRRAAGTEVVTDLLVFRRREDGVPPKDLLWETVTARTIDGELVKINSYFDRRPENILGTLGVGTGMHGSQTLRVVAPDLAGVAPALRTALDGVVADAREAGLLVTERSAASAATLEAHRQAEPGKWDGSIAAEPDGSFSVVERGAYTPLAVPKSSAKELRALLGLRDAATALLAAEAETLEDTPAIAALRGTLRTRFDAYQDSYGPLNRFTTRSTGRVNKETGEEGKARIIPGPLRILRQDPFGALVMALERFDEEEMTASPASLVTQRVVAPRAEVQGAETPAEAVAISLDQTGRVDLDTIAHLLGQTPEEARTALGTLVYDDPAKGGLVHAPEYLSGDVRVKLDAAQSADAENPGRYATNIAALREVIPADLTMLDIRVSLGAVWIDAETHRQFLAEILKDDTVRVENASPGMWEVKGQRHSLLATTEWGTERRPATDIAAAVMEQRALTVYDEVEDDGKTRRVLNSVETTAAQEKADQMSERFAGWVWEDPERAQRLATEYNRRFNSIVLRDYSQAGDYLTLPGVATNFVPRQHQRAAVARMVAEPAVGLFHEVGAGKTATMAIGVGEMRRMGLVNKPVVVVPGHMLEQFSREWLQIYPQARILAASSKDIAGDKRRLFVARAAANDWDAIIMTQTAFERISLSPDTEAAYIQSEVEVLRASLEGAGADSMSVKRIEKAVQRAEERYKKVLDRPRDPGLTFEETGIDYVCMDEAHMVKNLATTSNIRGAGIDGSARATDMHMKLEYLRTEHGERVGTMATATPLANSITEAHVMLRYLRPDLLRNAGLNHFDAWAATFGKTVTEMEISPAGDGKFRLNTRFAKFQNVPEMLRMWHVFADVKTADDLQLPTPALRERADGQRLPENIVLQPTAEVADYIQAIGERAEAVQNKQVPPEEDNMLKISTDGRKAALDIRMVDPSVQPSGPTKIDAVASKVLNIWNETKHREYLDDVTGKTSPVTGGLQIVFCDLGTPNPGGWSAYEELRSSLVDGGMPAEQVRFIHEAKTDSDKARLFAAARAGHVSVLVGSTEKMGVGTNVQARAIALHHVDCPWRPADIQQRDGRILRQGNQNAEIGLYRYVVERSFDTYMWSAVERKSKFIAQIMRGKLDVREIDDIGDAALSAAETKAISSGNPLVLEQSVAANELSKLERLERAYSRNQLNIGARRNTASERIDVYGRQLEELAVALPRAIDTSEDRFKMEVGTGVYDKRADAGIAIGDWAAMRGVRYLPAVYGERPLGQLGSIGGFEIDTIARQGTVAGVEIVTELRGVPGSRLVFPRDTFVEGGIGIVRQLENRAAAIPKLITEKEAQRAAAVVEVAEAEERLGKPFPHSAELATARDRLALVNSQLDAMAKESEAENGRGSAPDAAPTPTPTPTPAPEQKQGTDAAFDAVARARLGFAAPMRDATSQPAPEAREPERPGTDERGPSGVER